MLIKQLQATGPEHDGDLWLDYEALYKGGKAFRARIERFLPQNEAEHFNVYQRRKREAHYRGYIGTAIDYFAALLFAHELTTTSTRPESDAEVTLDWAAGFHSDADGSGSDLLDVVRDGFVDALIKRCGAWRLDFPDTYGTATDRASAEKDGSLGIRLARVPRETILDLERDDTGRLLWVIIHEADKPRPSPDAPRNVTRHRWWVLDRTHARRYEALVKDGEELNAEAALTPAAEVAHGLKEVPMVDLDVGDGLWVANRLESAQLEHFRLSCANAWSMRRTCYAMPLFRVKDPENWAPPVMGAGYYLAIGEAENGDWMAPPNGHLSVVREEVSTIKDEIFRLVSQMSLGIDNNAASVGRSAESKEADAEVIQVILRAYGTKVRDAIRRILEMVAKARGDEVDWTIEGLDRFETLDPQLLVELLETALALDIPSKAFNVEAKVRAALALLPGLDKETRDLIRREVTESVEAEGEEPEPPSVPGDHPPDGHMTEDDDAEGSERGDGATPPGRAGAPRNGPSRRTARR